MELTGNSLLSLAIFLLLVGSAILIHELGHFLAARGAGIRIEELGLGLPPRIKRLGTWRGTEITLNWIPLGGFVRPAGEFDAAVPGGLAASPPISRMLVLLAGSGANLLLAFALLTAGMVAGWPDRVEIVQVMTGSPADRAGLQAGDIVEAAQGVEVHDTGVLRDLIQAQRGEPMALDVRRGDQPLAVELTPRTAWPEGEGPAGFTTRFQLVRYPLPRAAERGAAQLTGLIRSTVRLTARLLVGEGEVDTVRLSGPLGLKQLSDQAVDNAFEFGEAFPVLYIGAWISVALALTNLLPLPALDGGRVLFVLLGVLRGRQIDAKVEKLVHAVGMVGLLALLLALTARDIVDPLF
jgi:regulator of sigma E protease